MSSSETFNQRTADKLPLLLLHRLLMLALCDRNLVENVIFFPAQDKNSSPSTCKFLFLSCLGRIERLPVYVFCVFPGFFCRLLWCSLVLPTGLMFPPHLLPSPPSFLVFFPSHYHQRCFSTSLLLHLVLSLARSCSLYRAQNFIRCSSCCVCAHRCLQQITKPSNNKDKDINFQNAFLKLHAAKSWLWD